MFVYIKSDQTKNRKMSTIVQKKLPIFSSSSIRAVAAGRRFFKSYLGLPKNAKINDLKTLLEVRTQRQADRIMIRMYNQHASEENAKLDLLRKQIKREKRLAQRQARMKAVLGESAYKSYQMWTVYTNPTDFFTRYTVTSKTCITISSELVGEYNKRIFSAIRPVLVRRLQEDESLRVFCARHVQKGKIDESENLVSAEYIENLGRARNDLTCVDDFLAYLNEKNVVTDNDSYGVVYNITRIDISIVRYLPHAGASYSPLPEMIKNTKSVINIQNKDNKCFLWSCIASRHLPERDAERVSKYLPFVTEFEYEETDFPMTMQGIAKFEKRNNVAVTVFTVTKDQKDRFKLRPSESQAEEKINLFYWDGHYSLIKNYSRFFGGHQHVCENCTLTYANHECYLKHVADCKNLNENGSLVKAAEEGTVTKFTGYKKQKRLPVVIYADFESSLVDSNVVSKNGKEREVGYVNARHDANSYRIQIVSDVSLLGIPMQYSYVGSDAARHFIQTILKLDKEISDCLQRYINQFEVLPPLPREYSDAYYSQPTCLYCDKEFVEGISKLQRVRDHCHFTGKYIGAAHRGCNLQARQTSYGKVEIPCFFHNANYDIRCFINAFAEIEGDEALRMRRLDGVPTNMEFFKCLQMNNITIKDSMSHLSCSLEKLLENLPDTEKHHIRTIVGDDEEKYKLITKKGFYPYEFVTDISKLATPMSEIRREHFDSKLRLSKISDEDWEHIQTVVRAFGIQTLREWHDLYLKIDVLGLSDVFEYYRGLTFQTHGLDPAHYMGLPALSWDAGLRFTRVELENLSDIDMVMFFEKLKRGGISVISKRYAKANNPYLPDYNPEQETSYLLQLDCNNLYGWAMCQMLPTKEFKWVTPESVDLATYDPSGNTGYVLEVDLEYPAHLHDAHNDYPLAPEHMQLSTRKLTPNLNDKEKYVVYVDTLRFYLEKGMVLKKIHRVVQFERQAWLKPYIDKNSAMRQQAKNDFDKDYYKLLNNAFYGKTMEN